MRNAGYALFAIVFWAVCAVIAIAAGNTLHGAGSILARTFFALLGMILPLGMLAETGTLAAVCGWLAKQERLIKREFSY
jgi:hypothetical protein